MTATANGGEGDDGAGTATTTTNALGYPSLVPKSPVPSDIEISHSIVRDVGLLPISDVAKQYVLCLS